MSMVLWAGFLGVVLLLLAMDLFIVHRPGEEPSARRATAWTAFTVVVGLAFAGVVWWVYGHGWMGYGAELAEKLGPGKSVGREAAAQYLTAWLLEYSLSVDNIFVFAIIFAYFGVPRKFQQRSLLWGVIAAVVLRGSMILAGAALVQQFNWMMYVLGAVLLITAYKMLRAGDDAVHPDRNVFVRLARKFFPVSSDFDGERFFTRLPAEGAAAAGPGGLADGVQRAGKLAMTPMFLVLIVINTTDVVFAVDSIPAALGVTSDPFLVFTSNIFAVLGLRSLYFTLAAFIDRFRYLKTSLVFVLAFIGVKMLLEGVVHVPTSAALGVVAGILVLGVVASGLAGRIERRRRRPPIEDIALAAEEAWKRSRKIVILVLGVTILLLAIPVGLLPGPGGIAFAVGGLALLATEFVWARSLLRRVKSESQAIANRMDTMVARKPRPYLVPFIVALYAALVFAAWVYIPAETHKWLREVALWGSIGPGLAVVFWSYLNISLWIRQRNRGGAAEGRGAEERGESKRPAA